MADAAAEIDDVYRDFVTDGVPASGANEPKKSEIRQLLHDMLNVSAAGAAGIGSYATADDLPATVGDDDAKLAVVTADETSSNNTFWVWDTSTSKWIIFQAFYDNITAEVDAGADLSKAWATSPDEPDPDNAPGEQSAKTYAERAAADQALYKGESRIYRDAIPGYVYPDITTDGVQLGGVLPDGNRRLPGVVVSAPPTEAVTRDVSLGIIPIIPVFDRPDRYLIGWNTVAKRVELAGWTGGAAGGGYLDPSVLRGSWGSSAYNVRQDDDFYVATVTDRSGRSYDAKQRKTGAEATLLLASAAPIDVLLVYGQSNSGNGGGDATVEIRALYPFSVHQLAGLANGAAYGSAAIDAGDYTDITPAYDSAGAVGVGGQWPAKMVSFAYQHFNTLRGRTEAGVLAGTAWEGSQPLSSFFPEAAGHHNYENAVAILTAMRAAAALYGRTIRATMLFIQGEAGPSGRTTYGNTLGLDDGNLLDAILPGLKAAAGMEEDIKVIISQTNVLAGASENYACMGQYDVAQGRADTVLAGPQYQFPILHQTDGDDNPVYAHLTSLGRMMQGGPLAEAWASAICTGDWKPVQIASAVRDGAVLHLTYEGSIFGEGYKLALDTDWTPTVDHAGFAAYGGGVGAIADVTITGANTIDITFAAAIPSGVTFQYATRANWTNDGVNNGWAERLGNIMVETDRPDLFHTLGYPLPRCVRHYAIRQEFTLS